MFSELVEILVKNFAVFSEKIILAQLKEAKQVVRKNGRFFSIFFRAWNNRRNLRLQTNCI